MFSLDDWAAGMAPNIPRAEWRAALAWCRKFGRSWRDARERRKVMVEQLEQRNLLSVSGSVDVPSQVPEGQGAIVNVAWTTNHNDVDGGSAHEHVDWGDGATTDFDDTAGQHSVSHLYDGFSGQQYDVSVHVTDNDGGYGDGGYGDGYGDGYGGSSSFDGGGTVTLTDDQLHQVSAPDQDFEPNQPIFPDWWQGPQVLAEFGVSDGYVPGHLERFSGTINWGDGQITSAAFQENPDDHGIWVTGNHTFSYVTDENGEVVQPLWLNGEHADYPVDIHVQEDTGPQIDLMWTAHAHTRNYINITDPTTPANNIAPPPTPWWWSGTSVPTCVTCNISIAANPGNGAGLCTYVLTASERDRNDALTPIAAAAAPGGTLTVTPTLIGGRRGPAGFSATASTGSPTETITITWTAGTATVGDSISLRVTDTNGATGTVLVVFTP